MKIRVPGTIILAVGIGACVTSAMFGAQTTTFTILGDAAGQFTMPYTGQTSSGGPTVPILCDDFTDEVNLGQSWLAFVTDLNQVPDNPNTVYFTSGGTNSYYGSSPAFTEEQDYVAAAYLAVQISELNPFNTTTSDELSAALWSVFEPGSNAIPNLSSGEQTVAETDLEKALTLASNGTYSSGQALESALGVDVKIYTAVYTDPTTGAQSVYTNSDPAPPGSPGTRPQEFFTVTQVPEPSTWAVLGFDLVGAGIAGLYFRRRQSGPRS